MFVWKKNGEVELIPDKFKSGATDPTSRQHRLDHDEFFLKNQETKDRIEQRGDNMTSSVPATAKLQIKVPNT